MNGTLDPPQMGLPVIGTSPSVGVELFNLLRSGPVTVHLMVDASVIATKSANVIADSPTGRADRTVVVAAHLDSVTEGPGINESATGTKGPNGSRNVEQVFLDYFAQQNLPTEPTEFDGRSDYGPFIDRGIPAGGLFTGAEGIKTADEAAIYGGTAGVAYLQPPGVRRPGQPEHHGARPDVGRNSRRSAPVRDDDVVRERDWAGVRQGHRQH